MLPRVGIATAQLHRVHRGEVQQALLQQAPDLRQGHQVGHRHVSPHQSTSSPAAKLFTTLTLRTLKSWPWRRVILSGWSRNWTMPGLRASFAVRRGCSLWTTWMSSSHCPRPSPTRSLSISTNLDPVHRGANLDFDCWTRLDCGEKLDFHHESSLDFIAEQYWIFNMKCVMYLCQIVKQMHARSSHMPRSHCAKCFCKMSTDIAVHARNPVCPADTRKYGFWTRHLCKLNQSLVSSVASKGGQDLCRKSLRFLSQCLSDSWKISLKFCRSWILEFL